MNQAIQSLAGLRTCGRVTKDRQDLVTVASQPAGASAKDGVRFRLPLRGSPGLSPAFPLIVTPNFQGQPATPINLSPALEKSITVSPFHSWQAIAVVVQEAIVGLLEALCLRALAI